MKGDSRIDSLASKCVNCGSCLAVCPIFKARTKEYLSPRGKVYVLQRLKDLSLEKEPELMDEFTKSLFDCTLCGYCDEVCKSDVSLIDLFKKERKKAIERQLYPSLSKLIDSVKSSGNIYRMDNEERLDLWFDDLGEEFPDLSNKIYRDGKKASTGIFLGCVLSFRSGQLNIIRSILTILETIGEDYLLFGGEEFCCGHPLHLTGDVDQAEAVRNHNRTIFKDAGISKLVTNCPGCLVSFREHYNFDNIEIQHFSQFLQERWRDIEPFIDNRVISGISGENTGKKLVYHDPCELSRICGVRTEPREVLGKVARYHELEALCCGGGGLLRVTADDLASEVAKNRLIDTGGQDIVTCCPSCHEQFRSKGVRTIDIVELVAAAMKKDNKLQEM
ncbi:MAG: (Fe-S)-binding protein [Candidatus Odinarchaeota archaeon]